VKFLKIMKISQILKLLIKLSFFGISLVLFIELFLQFAGDDKRFDVYSSLIIFIEVLLFMVMLILSIKDLQATLSLRIQTIAVKKKISLYIKKMRTLYSFFCLFTLLILPFIFIPSTVYSSPLSSKPSIIAHRGLSSRAPENTLIAGEKAAEINSEGWEIDVQISRDGIPFLMHDGNLKRTTNVEEIFPERKNEYASNFSMAELKQLDAGSWFSSSYIGEKIPTLQEVMMVLNSSTMFLDVDLKYPPSGHPFKSQ
jgi:Glycerophosphoryl diester phosphodiesterase family